MSTVLVAGASGGVGKAVTDQLKQRNYSIHALVRHKTKLGDRAASFAKIHEADARQSASLQGICEGVDCVFSTLGASLQLGLTKNSGTYWDIDFQANKNLLAEAQRANVRKFIYLSAFGANTVEGVAYFAAHTAFEKELQQAGIDYAIIRPTGIFYIFAEFVKLARRGIVPLFGNGSARTNPIHETDVARAGVEAIESSLKIFDIGGPEEFSRREIAALCFATLGKKPRFISYPPSFMNLFIKPIRWFDKRLYDLFHFAILASTQDFVAPKFGANKLESYLQQLTAGDRD